MKIYFASMGLVDINKEREREDLNILLSFYDLTISLIPFRKETFKWIKDCYENKPTEIV